MMPACEHAASGAVESLFYGDLAPADRSRVERHVRGCADCRAALEDLAVVRDALAGRPAPGAPPAGDWSPFMRRLERALAAERAVPAGASWSYRGLAAAAAMLVVSVLGVALAMRTTPERPAAIVERPAAAPAPDEDGFEAVTEEHFDRSKLVVLALAAKDPARTRDWRYERALADRLLSDTRLYRMTAEERGLGSIAAVMRDLELVLLQASFTDDRDPASLVHIQRLIRHRDLVGKLDAMAIAGS